MKIRQPNSVAEEKGVQRTVQQTLLSVADKCGRCCVLHQSTVFGHHHLSDRASQNETPAFGLR